MKILNIFIIIIIKVIVYCKSQENDELVLEIETNSETCEKLIENHTLLCSNIPSSPIEHTKIVINKKVKTLESNSFQEYHIKDNLHIELHALEKINSDAFNGLFAEENAQIRINIVCDDDSKIKLEIGPYAFRGAILSPGANVLISVSNYEELIFYENPFNGVNQINGYSIEFMIENTKKVFFKESSSDTHVLTSDYKDENDPVIIINDDPELRMFDEESNLMSQLVIVMDNVELIQFDKNSLSNLKQKKSSLFKIEARKTKKCIFQSHSLANLEQNEESTFKIVIRGEEIEFGDKILINTIQDHSSILKIDIKSDRNLCIASKFLSNLTQSNGSQVQVSLESSKNDLYINNLAFNIIKQDVNSIFKIQVTNVDNIFIDRHALSDITQHASSVFELNVKETNNLILDSKSIHNFAQKSCSKAKISFKQNSGTLYQLENVFAGITQEHTSDFIYEFDRIQTLVFPPRLVPKLVLLDRNQTIISTNAKPKQITLNYTLKESDHCSIIDIPSDILVKLPSETKCSCSVYYLYRNQRALKSDTTWISNTPLCYKNMYHNGGFDRIKIKEKNCNFDELARECRSRAIQVNMPTFERTKCNYQVLTDDKPYDIREPNTDDYIIDPSVEFSPSPFFDITKSTSLGIMIGIITLVIVSFLILLIVLIVKLKVSSSELQDDFHQEKSHSKRYNGRLPYVTNSKKSKKYSSMDSDSYLIKNNNTINQNDSLISNESKTLVVQLNGTNESRKTIGDNDESLKSDML